MDTILIVGSAMLAAVAVFFIWVLVSDSRAMKRRGAAPSNEIRATSATGQGGESEFDYGPADCFYDCMRAFRWEAVEESPCASACGLKP
jgi:hypothetical protein